MNPQPGAPNAAGLVLPRAGWREWVALPALGVTAVKAKVDTGARTSALHATALSRYRQAGKDRVRFLVHPLQGCSDLSVTCEAELLDERLVTDSGGHRERRFTIRTPVVLGAVRWDIEVTLTDRGSMRFRMLLGRQALKGRFWVDPAASYCAGPTPAPQCPPGETTEGHHP